jgi:hypothetical protein
MTNKPQVPKGLLLANARERQQIFHRLKKHSSYTAWKRILGYYQAWSDSAEASVREADNRGLLGSIMLHNEKGEPVPADDTDITYRDHVMILKGLAQFEEGVNRLGKGDKRVFTYSDVHGFFAKAGVRTDIWETRVFRTKDGEHSWEPQTPYLEEFLECLKTLCAVWSECCEILEERDLDAPARCFYDSWEETRLPKLPYPEPLPEVQEPSENILVATGKRVPCSGIWEPVIEPDRPVRWLFKWKPTGPFKIVGTMNYLHGGTKAPQATQAFRNGEYSTERTDVEWRLLWRDDRYEDGTIPEEEKDYVFLEPMPPSLQHRA